MASSIKFFFLKGEGMIVDFSASLIADLIWKLILRRIIIISPLLILM